MTAYNITGGCLCGGVKFTITKPPSQIRICHCNICRKSIGADYGVDGSVPLDHFKLEKSDTLKEYNSSEHLTRCFCGVCGCTVVAKCPVGTSLSPLNCVFVFLGTLDGDPGVFPEAHIFVKEKAPWVNITDNLPQHEGYESLNFEECKH